ncbi:RNA-binding protein 2 [Rhynchospora pubera]|uniref:RNA-binding protein 2 n=1 Tax=Rhynchospora pubera TaxID=906938 RepID=A0AAV8G4C0_9POAL|nr:RNA-binding protein 2 [Rhynchospora pubera]
MADPYRGSASAEATAIPGGRAGHITRTDMPGAEGVRTISLSGNPDLSGGVEGKSSGIDPVPASKGLNGDESNILFVDGLPTDCTRREVTHLFRPFAGFKDIKIVHKEPRRRGEKGHVLCFVEFADAKHAGAALKILNGYQFDLKKPEVGSITIHFAKFPFRPPGSSATAG